MEAEDVRQDVATVFRRSKPPKSNLSRVERTALRALKEDSSGIVLPADKGNATVIMKTETYTEKMLKMIKGDTYKLVRK